MIIAENARVDLRSTCITELEQHTVEIVAADYSENNAERSRGQLVGRVASITMDVVLHWENGAVQPAELDVPRFPDWNGKHALLVWMTNESSAPTSACNRRRGPSGRQCRRHISIRTVRFSMRSMSITTSGAGAGAPAE